MQKIIEVTSPSTKGKIQVMPIPQEEMFAGLVAAYQATPKGNWDDDREAEVMAKGIVYKSLDYIVRKGYLKVARKDLRKFRAKVLKGAEKLNILLHQKLENDKDLLFANIILGPDGIFPKGEEDKFALWSIIMKQCGLKDIDIDFESMMRAAKEASN